MQFYLSNIDRKADLFGVKRGCAGLLHSQTFRRWGCYNFDVQLVYDRDEYDQEREVHNGTGYLTVPERNIGKLLCSLMDRGSQLEIKPYILKYGVTLMLSKRSMFLKKSRYDPDSLTLFILKRVPYKDPDEDRVREEKLRSIREHHFRADSLQIGRFLTSSQQARSFTSRPDQGEAMIFAVEWEENYTSKGNAILTVDYDRKLFRLEMGEPFQDQEALSVIIKFSNVQELFIGYEGNPHICFRLAAPAIMEAEWINRELTGYAKQDSQKFRRRINALDEGHRIINSYVHDIRVLLYQADLNEFASLCAAAGLQEPRKLSIASEKLHLFTPRKLSQIQHCFKQLQGRNVPWGVLFQIEFMLRNGSLTTDIFLTQLWPAIDELSKNPPDQLEQILRDYSLSILTDPRVVSYKGRLRMKVDDYLNSRLVCSPKNNENVLMTAYHVTFTPTRMNLEGPYAIQSNRVLRRYSDYSSNFVRVDFRDEDRLQFRWEREVDGTTFLKERVGEILKHGFDLGLKHFDFLAYSSSALREHAVWFVSEFKHEQKGLVNAAVIRRELGDLSDLDLVTVPSLFAARLAQAFTATEASVKLTSDQYREVPDLGRKPYLHTDGVGTISKELARRIWEVLCKRNPSYLNKLEPSAYQIRFLGSKGVVSVDSNLDGIMMHLRSSMAKFEVHEEGDADIEIAKAFHSPGVMHLNRPLIMILEDRGVKLEIFTKLLDDAIAELMQAKKSITKFMAVLARLSFGSSFGVYNLLRRLSSYGLDFCEGQPGKSLRLPFFNDIVYCSVSAALRDLKLRGRIPVPQSWLLVGVADEGAAYIKSDKCKSKKDDVYTLNEGEIYVCIQDRPGSEPLYLEGQCMVTRSPSVHPGDVMTARAIGRPPQDKMCAFRDLKNVIVFPAIGDERSIPSCLGGGDLDGDEYIVSAYTPLLPRHRFQPAAYPPVGRKKIEEELVMDSDGNINQEKVMPYVSDFVVEYMNSNVLGFLSDMHLVRADHSVMGTKDPVCIELAKLCSQAVDYPKNGMPVPLNRLPRPILYHRPDWKKGEDKNARDSDYYRSERAIGHLYRRANADANLLSEAERRHIKPPLLHAHPVFLALDPVITSTLRQLKVPIRGYDSSDESSNGTGIGTDPDALFRWYKSEISYVCATHALGDAGGGLRPLSEAEAVMGVILVRPGAAQRQGMRNDRMYRMRVHLLDLVYQTKGILIQAHADERVVARDVLQLTLAQAGAALVSTWAAWKRATEQLASYSRRAENMGVASDASKPGFGLNSFAFILLDVTFDCLDRIRLGLVTSEI